MLLIFIFILFIIRYISGEEWTIHVYTGAERFAGTDSNIYISLFNSKFGITSEYELTHENWIMKSDSFPVKNLFEYGEHDRFRISTKNIEFVEKLYVRRSSFPSIQSDWLLDRIIVERNRDSKKFIFTCNCWLRKEQPSVIIPASSDLPLTHKTNSIQNNQPIIIILIGSIALISCSICCVCAYCRQRQPRDFIPIETQQESSIFERCYPQLPEASAPSLFQDPRNRWETVSHILPSDSNSSTATIQPIPISSIDESYFPPAPMYPMLIPPVDEFFVIRESTIMISTDEPPAYSDLFPN